MQKVHEFRHHIVFNISNACSVHRCFQNLFCVRSSTTTTTQSSFPARPLTCGNLIIKSSSSRNLDRREGQREVMQLFVLVLHSQTRQKQHFSFARSTSALVWPCVTKLECVCTRGEKKWLAKYPPWLCPTGIHFHFYCCSPLLATRLPVRAHLQPRAGEHLSSVSPLLPDQADQRSALSRTQPRSSWLAASPSNCQQ